MKKSRNAPAATVPTSQGDLFSASAQTAPKAPPARASEPSSRLPEIRIPSASSQMRTAPLPLPVRNEVAPTPGRMVWSVGELTRAMKEVLEEGFARVLVRGEISGFKGPNARGHLYFNLKDAEACLPVTIWASVAQRLKFRPREGLSVIAEGSIDLYAPSGKYSLVIQKLEPEGEGALALAFQQLKERLTAEGLMGEHRLRAPRPIPFLPRRIGIVTSRTGAALHDFVHVLHARNPRLSVLLCDARVQGDGSARDVVRALERLSRTDVDVIVVARGGGSLEDLWTFNEEAVARAIHACPVPVISAIGHQTDFTIADFVADYRAPTPSAAAEKLSPVLHELIAGLRSAEARLITSAEHRILSARRELSGLQRRLADPRHRLSDQRHRLDALADGLTRRMQQKLRTERERFRGLQARVERQHPRARLARHREELARLLKRLSAASRQSLKRQKPVQSLERRLVMAMRETLSLRRRRGQELSGKLDAMSPLKVMGRGYAVVFRGEHLVRSAGEVAPGDSVRIRLAPAGTAALADAETIDATVQGKST